MSPIRSRIQARQSEQEVLLQRVITFLRADERVVAAWLFGSRGRGSADALSDLDLWVIVQDEVIEEICTERQAYVAQISEPVLLLDSEQNAPKGGAYLMALYPGQEGVQQVDWYWQKQSDASFPRQAVILFSHGNIPQDSRLEQLDPPGTEKPLSQEAQIAQVTALNKFFWVMANIAVKSMVRHQSWTAINHLERLRGLIDSTKVLLGLSTQQAGREEWRSTILPPVHALEQLAMLREITAEMEQLTPVIEQRGGKVEVKAIPYIYADFGLAQILIEQEMTMSQCSF